MRSIKASIWWSRKTVWVWGIASLVVFLLPYLLAFLFPGPQVSESGANQGFDLAMILILAIVILVTYSGKFGFLFQNNLSPRNRACSVMCSTVLTSALVSLIVFLAGPLLAALYGIAGMNAHNLYSFGYLGQEGFQVIHGLDFFLLCLLFTSSVVFLSSLSYPLDRWKKLVFLIGLFILTCIFLSLSIGLIYNVDSPIFGFSLTHDLRVKLEEFISWIFLGGWNHLRIVMLLWSSVHLLLIELVVRNLQMKKK